MDNIYNFRTNKLFNSIQSSNILVLYYKILMTLCNKYKHIMMYH